MNEKQQEIRLITIDPKSGKVLSIQALATTKDLRLAHDPMRRVQAKLRYRSAALPATVREIDGGLVLDLDERRLWDSRQLLADMVYAHASS